MARACVEGNMPSRRWAPRLAAFVLGVAFVPLSALQERQPPLKSGIELVLVDVQVVDRKGQPIAGLGPANFQVTLDGKRRTVVSAQLLDSNSGLPARAGAAIPPNATAPAAAPPGAIYVLAVDQGSFRQVNAPSVVHAAREFLKRVQPNDYVGMISFPSPGVRVDPTRDRAVLESAIPKLVGFSAVKQMRQYQYSLSDAIDVASGERSALDRAAERSCPGVTGMGLQMCRSGIEMEMNETVSLLEAQAARSLAGVRDAIASTAGIAGRKILVVMSAGIPAGDRMGARLYMKNDAMTAAEEAVAAGVLLYTLHLNAHFLDAFSPDAPSAHQTAMREAGVYARGLDIFSGNAGGTFLEVNASADSAIARMMRETSAYYLLGVEVEDADRDGRSHRIQVKVSQRGSQVRNRASVVVPRKPS
jgi:VWFA-related protein